MVINRLRQPIFWLAILSTAVLLAACGGVSPGEQTLEVQRENIATQLHGLQTTATVETERLQITLEYVETRIARAEEQRGEMLATLAERGLDINQLPSVATLPARPTENVAPALNLDETAILTATPVIEITPHNVTPTVPPAPPVLTLIDSGTISLRDIVMAASVGVNDCAAQVTNRFAPTSERIYIVARAVEVSASAVISARWFRGEVELTQFDYVPGFVIEDACIWFYADQTDFEFLPGDYTVSLLLNGAPASPPIPFTIGSNNSPKS